MCGKDSEKSKRGKEIGFYRFGIELFFTFERSMKELIDNKLQDIIALCKLHHVSSISLFGSVAKNTMNEGSDIDFLVEFNDSIDVLDYADNYFTLLEKLEILLGKKIDLVSKRSLKNPVLIEEIDRFKIDLYAA